MSLHPLDRQWTDDPYIGLDGHWYIRWFGYLLWRSDWRVL